MFIYLSKKIAIPNGINLYSLAWNPDQGWIACGGDSGLLKVLKLELTTRAGDQKAKTGVAAPSNLSMNQTLDGHHGKVVCVTWNALYRKLTTSDESGLIIVWMLHKGMWFEEMINNRNKSVVKDMKWTADGSKICIVYADGAVIVGSVDGNRLWGKELEMQLIFVEWSPDCRYILFVTQEAQVWAYDAMGNKIKRLNLPGKDDGEGEGKDAVEIVGINWYDGAEGHVDVTAPTLAIAFSNGRVQITRGTEDPDPVIIDTKLQPLCQCKWNTRGSVLAVAGTHTHTGSNGETRDMTVVQFYDPHGLYLRTLKVPGTGINALSWEGGGLRIALAVDAYIYFANIRPDYKWGYFSNTLVYSYTRPDRTDSSVLFWDMTSDERYVKTIEGLKHIAAAGDNCVIVTGPEPDGTYKLSLCNAIGAPIDTKYTTIKPCYVSMTPFHIAVADKRVTYVWQYRTQSLKLASNDASAATNSLRKNPGRERMLDIDNFSDSPAVTVETFTYPEGECKDPISAITASDKNLIVARESGMVHRYTLPHISLEQKNVVRCRPHLLRLNCSSGKLAIIDTNGMFYILDLDGTDDSSGQQGQQLQFERKDTWDMRWAEDNENMFAVMEKTRMYVFNDLQPQEPTLSSGYLASFKELEIKAVMLDDIMQQPDKPTTDMVVDFETKSLRDVREYIDSAGLADTYTYIEQNPHPRLWRLLAEASMNALDLGIADKAFVRCSDYKGIQYVKRLNSLGDKMKQRAEVAVYFGRIDEAEMIYRDIDRKDLAIDLRERQGDWMKVMQLVQTGGGDDQLMFKATTKIGDYYAEQFNWKKAVMYYQQAKQPEKMAECYYRLEDFSSLQKMVTMVPAGTPLLTTMAQMFESVGIHETATDCYLKAGDVRAGIDCCVLLNQWDRAVSLAEQHDYPQIEGLLSKYAKYLLDKGEKLQAVELYRKANKATDAAKLLAMIAEEVTKVQADPLRAKKLNVLAALEVERFRKTALDMSQVNGDTDVAQTTMKTLDTLMTMDQATADGGGKAAKVLDNAWRGAAAYHYYLLAQRQLYNGKMDAAMKTSIRLAEYEDVLDPKDIYSLVALTAFHNKYFGICSRAFIKLETMTNIPEDDRETIQNLALSIFTKNSPLDPHQLPEQYLSCLDTGTPYYACTASGRLIQVDSERSFIMCRTCRHYVLEREIQNVNNCPLCHSSLL